MDVRISPRSENLDIAVNRDVVARENIRRGIARCLASGVRVGEGVYVDIMIDDDVSVARIDLQAGAGGGAQPHARRHPGG